MTREDYLDIIQELNRKRIALALSYSELARLTGMPRDRIIRWLSCGEMPRKDAGKVTALIADMIGMCSRGMINYERRDKQMNAQSRRWVEEVMPPEKVRELYAWHKEHRGSMAWTARAVSMSKCTYSRKIRGLSSFYVKEYERVMQALKSREW